MLLDAASRPTVSWPHPLGDLIPRNGHWLRNPTTISRSARKSRTARRRRTQNEKNASRAVARTPRRAEIRTSPTWRRLLRLISLRSSSLDSLASHSQRLVGLRGAITDNTVRQAYSVPRVW